MSKTLPAAPSPAPAPAAAPPASKPAAAAAAPAVAPEPVVEPERTDPPAGKAKAKGPALGDDGDAATALGVIDPEDPDGSDADGTEDGDAADGAGDDAADDADPEPIEYSFEAPEGAPPYPDAVIAAYKDVLQKHRVEPETAKDLLDTMMPAIQADFDARVKAGIDEQTTAWRAELQERHGEQTTAVIKLANRALGKAASAELTTFLRDSALAVNPDFIDMLAYFGQRITNDRSVKPTGPAPAQDLSPMDEIAQDYERGQ